MLIVHAAPDTSLCSLCTSNVIVHVCFIGELVQLQGGLFTSAFEERNEDGEENSDYFTRILVGGMFCNAMNENGTL